MTTESVHTRPLRPKYHGIQALRFIAALLVVITHSTFYAKERLTPDTIFWGDGAIGVHIFFVISGFVMVVSSAPLVGKKDGWKYFVMRRLVRIAPMYWIATTLKIATMLVLPGAVLHAALEPHKVALSYLFLPSTNIDGRVEPLLGVGWTLVFEMFFYGLFALALFLRKNPIVLSGIVLAMCAIGFAFRPEEGWPAWAFYFNPIVLYFLIGMVMARLAQNPKALKYFPYAAAVSAAGALFILIHPGIDTDAGAGIPYPMFLTTAIVLLAVYFEPFLSRILPAWVLYLGGASYSLYLFHPMVAPIVPEVLSKVGIIQWELSVALSIIGSIIASVIIYRWLELPMTKRLQDKLPYVRTPRRYVAPAQNG